MLFGCSQKHKTEFELSEFGLTESNIGHAKIDSSVFIINSILKNICYLSPNWNKNQHFEGRRIKLFLVHPDGLPYNTIAQGYTDKDVIFISSDWENECKKEFESIWSSTTASQLTLSLILLHEIGHFENHSFPQKDIILDSLHLSNPTKMNNEFDADYFVVEALKKESNYSKLLSKHLFFLDSTISETYWWKYEGHGSILSMISKGDDLKKHYNDFNSEHPNLHLRFSIMSYFLEPTTEKLDNIKWIISRR